MKNYLKTTTLLVLLTFSVSIFSGCYGNLTVSKKVYNWNGKLGNRVVNTVVMWVLGAVQVYTALVFVDLVILNPIEFLTGKNPLAMTEGETEIRIVNSSGKLYQLTISKNQIEIETVHSKNPDKKTILFDEISGSWLLKTDTEIKKIAEIDPLNPEILIVKNVEGKEIPITISSY